MKITEKSIGPVNIASIITKREIGVHGIYIPDFLPETQAALGATLSRDPGSAESRLEKVLINPKTKERIMDLYFKKYGHNSIGDMGFFMFSFEGLSMKGAVDVLGSRLFNGQEASTRYLDFSDMGFLPISADIDSHSKECMGTYNEVKEYMMNFLMKEGVPEKEAEPQAFDVAGACLPISARTNVFWVGNIRTFITQIRKLMSGDDESREIGKAWSEVFHKICPNSMKDVGENYILNEINFGKMITDYKTPDGKVGLNWNSFNIKSFKSLDKRNFEICDELGIFGTVNAIFDFDFRSARDIHRHRAFFVNRVMKYSPTSLENFYLDAIPDKQLRNNVEEKFNRFIENQGSRTEGYYGLPMMTKFPYVMSGDLSAWLYFLNLRSGPKVHPTVIGISQEIGSEFENKLGLENIYQRGEVDYGKRSADKNKI